MTTKIDRVQSAYSQMRISGLTVTPSPEDLQLALNRLEAMMSELEFGRNICMNYNFEETPDPNSVTNVAMPFWYMIDTNLAIRLIPDFNKQVPQALVMQASQSMATASGISAINNIRQVAAPDRMPIGSGSTLRYNKYQRFNRESKLPPAVCTTNVIIKGNINDYDESFRAYLGNETIASFEFTVDRGLELISSSNNDPIIDYRIKGVSATTSGPWQQIRIVVTTSSGRVETRLINFEIRDNETVNNNR